MPKISVIVPIYKVEKYLPECIDSILKQSFQDFELILVDDGSPDSSGAICDEYAQKDKRIRVIHQENGGVTSARRAGGKAATGEWVCFVDGDDSIPEYSLQILYEGTKENTDIVIGTIDERKFLDSISLKDYRSSCIGGAIFHTALWAKLYRRHLFNDWIFDIPREIKVGEDWLANVRLSFMTNNPPTILKSAIVYNYRSRPESVMHTFVHNVEASTRGLDYLKKSIPGEYQDAFRYDYNLSVWLSLSMVVYDTPSDRSWQSSLLYAYLKDEIRNNRFRLKLSQRVALWPRNFLQLRIAIKLINILEFFNL